MTDIKIIIFVLIIMHILPIAITQLLILEYPFKDRKNGRIILWTCTVVNVLLNSLVLYEIIMYSKFNPVVFFNLTCSYQDISRLATSDIIALVLSVLIGIGINKGVRRYYKDEQFLHFPSKCILLFSFAAIPIILGYYYGCSGTSHLVIDEVCRKTINVEMAKQFWGEDVIDDEVCYVSVFNNGALTYELDQIYLSDNMDGLRKMQFSQKVAIKPGETHQFYMLDDNSLDIKKGGGSVVYLSDKFGNIVDELEVPALKQDESYKKMGADWQIINLAEESESITVSVPSFSRESGFYDDSFKLELTADPGTTIYYTLDSSNPTADSMKYSHPIYVYDRSEEENQYRSIRNVQADYLNRALIGEEPVDKCFVVRAVAVDNDGNYSDIITKSYFVNQDKYKDRTVISLVSDPDGLFGDEGIYVTGKAYDEKYLEAYAKMDENGEIDLSGMPQVNYLEKGIEWERESNLEVFENTDLRLSQPVGIRIQGANARYSVLKRFSIFARKEYSSSEYFDVDLLNDYSQHSMYLREGNLHAISQMIGRGRDVATTDFIKIDVFLNGEFWYTTYLHEKFNKKNFSQKYNLSKDNIAISTNGWLRGIVAEGKNPLPGFIDFVNENDFSDDENYLKCSEMLDIQSYIDWYCINLFLLNLDYNERLNCLYWHTIIPENKQEGDTRWRLALYDMDLKWNINRVYEANPFRMYEPDAVAARWPIYTALKQNDHFCKQFVLTFMDLINTNFSVDNTMGIMEKLGIDNGEYREFFEKRPEYIVPYMAEEFELSGTQETVTLSSNVSGTPITLNTISPELQPSVNTFSWTGSYFTDYPVTVTTNAPDFSHWEVIANGRVQTFVDTTIEVPVMEGGVQIHAVFK